MGFDGPRLFPVDYFEDPDYAFASLYSERLSGFPPTIVFIDFFLKGLACFWLAYSPLISFQPSFPNDPGT